MIGRRHAIAVSLSSTVFGSAAARAQSSGRIHRLAVLTTNAASVAAIRAVTLPELARLGFVEGHNLVVDTRIGPADSLASLARELVSGRPDVAIAFPRNAIEALAAASAMLPIVMSFIGNDPVALGMVESLRRPGGRLTGQMVLAEELDPKRLAILVEALPRARRIAVFTPDPQFNPSIDDNMRAAAARLGVEITWVRIASSAQYGDAFARLRHAGIDAVVFGSSPEFARDVAELARLAIAARIATICQWSFMARDGCMLGYGPSYEAMRRRTADVVARILRGASPAELPIEGPTVFEFAVNLRTAGALGVEIPHAVLASADEVIE